MTTSKGVCWSIGSRPLKMPYAFDSNGDPNKYYIFCANHLAKDQDKSRCPKPMFCNRRDSSSFTFPQSFSSDLLNTPYKEIYINGETCWKIGIEMSGTEFRFGCDVNGSENITENKQCDFSSFSCNGTPQIIDGECINLRSRKCSYKDTNGLELPACCSDVVDMVQCTSGGRNR